MLFHLWVDKFFSSHSAMGHMMEYGPPPTALAVNNPMKPHDTFYNALTPVWANTKHKLLLILSNGLTTAKPHCLSWPASFPAYTGTAPVIFNSHQCQMLCHCHQARLHRMAQQPPGWEAFPVGRVATPPPTRGELHTLCHLLSSFLLYQTTHHHPQPLEPL